MKIHRIQSCQRTFSALSLAASVLLSAVTGVVSASASDLEAEFREPPAPKRPYVWWHWMGPNFSKPGITADLEAMKESGIAGATIFHLTSAVQESQLPTGNNPWPEQTYHSPAWWEAMRHAAAEADRLGLELGLHNTVGYSTTGGPWIDEARSMQQLVYSVERVEGGSSTSLALKKPELVANEGWGRSGRASPRTLEYYQDIAVLAVPDDASPVSLTAIIDLSEAFDRESGHLQAALPPGKWAVFRIGHASKGMPPHPVPDELMGKVLEVDKMCAEQNNFHWDQVLHSLQQNLGEFMGKSFRHILIDSYEAGKQSWTPDFREAFMERKGYDPLPWMLTLETEKQRRQVVPGAVTAIESEAQTARFAWDFQDVVNQLIIEDGWELAKRRLDALGLELQFEAYGGPFSVAEATALADLPMGEFWTGGDGGISPVVVGAARAAGKHRIGAEAFTGRPERSQYTEDPAFLKRSADGSFASGVNRMILHHWVHQPFDDRYKPGMGMGWWGTHFGRHQTWFEPGKAFFRYLARCQVLLQEGEAVADFLCVEDLVGQQDLIAMGDFLQWDIRVDNGQVVLPSGRRYPFIAFPQKPTLLPEVLEKMRQLLHEGASVVATRPVASPSLKDYPQADARVNSLAAEIWGAESGETEPPPFAGRLFSTTKEAVSHFGIEPGFRLLGGETMEGLKTSHRRTETGAIFFLANLSEDFRNFTGSFHVKGLQPEIWSPEDGRIESAAVWRGEGKRTEVTLQLRPGEALFVVFRAPVNKVTAPTRVIGDDPGVAWSTATDANGKHVLRTRASARFEVFYPDGEVRALSTQAAATTELKGPWKLHFEPATEEPAFEREFPALQDFSTHSDPQVRFFAGRTIYRSEFHLDAAQLGSGQRVLLDLGSLNDIAEVRVNGHAWQVSWYPPYEIDISPFVSVGRNQLEIAVINNWANRLIGDEQEPADFEWGSDRGEKLGRAILAYPDWFLQNQPRPSAGRKTFSIWHYYRQDSPLKSAGLVGPVRLVFESEYPL